LTPALQDKVQFTGYTEEISRIVNCSCRQMAGHVAVTDRLERKIKQHQNDSNRAISWVTLQR